MKITFRDFKIFMFGMISAFILTLIVYNASLSQQQIIANGIEIGVLAMVALLVCSLFLGIGINLYRSMKSSVSPETKTGE